MESAHDLWHVKLSEGCVVEMTLDEVDTAFNAGRISASTSVLAPGEFRWTTLGAAAGLDDAASPEPEPEPAPFSIAPVAADITPPPPVYDFASETPSYPPPSYPPPPPRRTGVLGKVVGISALFGVLIVVGMTAGAYAAGPGEFTSRIASVRDRFSGASARSAAVAAPPAAQAAPAAPAPTEVAAAPAPAPAPTMEEETAPAPVAAAPSAPATTSVDDLPNAKAKAKAKRPARAKNKRR